VAHEKTLPPDVFEVSVIHGHPAECNTTGPHECNMLLYPAYTCETTPNPIDIIITRYHYRYLITNLKRPPFLGPSISVELSRPSYFELAIPNDPRRSSPPYAKVEVAVEVSFRETCKATSQ
jgi:hypothetical protein